GPHDVGERQQTWDQVFRGNIGGGHQSAISEWDAQQRRLRGADELGMLAGRLIAGLAVGTSVVGGEERSDDELARLDRGDRAANPSTMPQYSCPIGVGWVAGFLPG